MKNLEILLSNLKDLKKKLKIKSLLFLSANLNDINDILLINNILSSVFIQQIKSDIFIKLNKALQFLEKIKIFHFSPFGVFYALNQNKFFHRYKFPLLVIGRQISLSDIVNKYAELVVNLEIYFVVDSSSLDSLIKLLALKSVNVEVLEFNVANANLISIVKFKTIDELK